MKDPNYELSYIQASLEELEAYLLSKDLFWPVTAPAPVGPLPKLTIGNLLLSLNYLKGYSDARKLDTVQRSTYVGLERLVEAHQQKWTVAWQTKAAHEFQSRLRQWIHYLNDFEKNEDANAPFYQTEIRNRVLLEILREHAPEDAQNALDKLDILLRGRFKPNDFIWEPQIQSAFPKKDFWFLYGTIAK